MHPRNRHQGLYDFALLTKALPELASFVVDRFGKKTIEFTNPKAVKALNRAILKAHYGINFWDIPEDFLTPPIPGRADYIHALADLIGEKKGPEVRVLDIGTGANLIYPLIGNAEYGWNFVGSEINPEAAANANKIVKENKLEKAIEVREQSAGKIFSGIIKPGEKFDLTLCNPPFHSSLDEAMEGTARKWKNLKRGKPGTHRNFGGQGSELWIEGGERTFVGKMIEESLLMKQQVSWFTTLVSKDTNVPVFEAMLRKCSPREVRTIPMSQGAKKSRILAWCF
jgi:23S rRNA (adenine1618-N6)-methyltransferase